MNDGVNHRIQDPSVIFNFIQTERSSYEDNEHYIYGQLDKWRRQ